MQSFIVKLVCFFLFGFIFYSAYLTNGTDLYAIAKNSNDKSRTILVANKLETKTFTVKMQEHTLLGERTNYAKIN